MGLCMSKFKFKKSKNIRQDEFSFSDDNYLIYNHDYNVYQDINGNVCDV
jgi:hypothetical protein